MLYKTILIYFRIKERGVLMIDILIAESRRLFPVMIFMESLFFMIKNNIMESRFTRGLYVQIARSRQNPVQFRRVESGIGVSPGMPRKKHIKRKTMQNQGRHCPLRMNAGERRSHECF